MKLRFIECHIPKHLFTGIDEIKEWEGVIWAHVRVNGFYSYYRNLNDIK